MKNLIILFLITFTSHLIFGQGCVDFVDIEIEKRPDINTFGFDIDLQIPGNNTVEKADYFVERWKAFKMSKISNNIDYVRLKQSSVIGNSVKYVQVLEGREIAGSYFRLVFNKDGYLKFYSHYGIEDSKQIDRFNRSLNVNTDISYATSNEVFSSELRLVNNELKYVPMEKEVDKPKLNKEIGVPTSSLLVQGSIYISNCDHDYTYSCIDDNDIVDMNNLIEIGVGGSTTGGGNSRLTFVTPDNVNFNLVDTDDVIAVQSSTAFFHNSTDYLICPESASGGAFSTGKYEYAMCFHHLTRFSTFFNNNFSDFGNFGTLNFNPYDTNLSLIYAVDSDVVRYGASNDDDISGNHDTAEDESVITAGAFHYWWLNNSGYSINEIPSQNIASGDGVFYGTLDYVVNSFVGCQNNLYSWGTTGGGRTVVLSPNDNYDNFVNADNSAGENGQLWGATLVELQGGIGLNKVNRILGLCLGQLGPATGQKEIAALFMTIAENEGCTDEELCTIAGVLESRYPSLSFDINFHDFYIKDSEDGQGDNQEDFGIEPSVTTQMWVSPAIWNRRNPDQGTTHQHPQHIVDAPNYLYVELRDIGCEPPTEGRLRMYFSEASTGHTWPQDWDNAVPTNENLGYRAGNVLLTDYIDSYEDEDMEQVYLYEIKWFPLDPTDFDGYGDNDNMHGCVLGRIDSGQDPIINEGQNVHVSQNSRAFNNVAMRNMTLMHVESGPFAPPIPPKHVLMIKHGLTTDLDNHIDVVSDDILIELDRNGVIPAEQVHLFGDIEIELSEELMNAWIDGGMKGENIQFLPPNRIVIESPTTKLMNVKLLPTKKYPIRVSFDQKREFNEDINFAIRLVNEGGCEVGGEGYRIFTNDEERLEKRSDLTIENKIASSDLIVSPNPVSDILTISINGKTDQIDRFEIYNVSGQRMNTNIISSSDNFIESDMSFLIEGLYYIRIDLTSGDVINKKIIKL